MAEMADFLRILPLLIVIAVVSFGAYSAPINYGDTGKPIYHVLGLNQPFFYHSTSRPMFSCSPSLPGRGVDG